MTKADDVHRTVDERSRNISVAGALAARVQADENRPADLSEKRKRRRDARALVPNRGDGQIRELRPQVSSAQSQISGVLSSDLPPQLLYRQPQQPSQSLFDMPPPPSDQQRQQLPSSAQDVSRSGRSHFTSSIGAATEVETDYRQGSRRIQLPSFEEVISNIGSAKLKNWGDGRLNEPGSAS